MDQEYKDSACYKRTCGHSTEDPKSLAEPKLPIADSITHIDRADDTTLKSLHSELVRSKDAFESQADNATVEEITRRMQLINFCLDRAQEARGGYKKTTVHEREDERTDAARWIHRCRTWARTTTRDSASTASPEENAPISDTDDWDISGHLADRMILSIERAAKIERAYRKSQEKSFLQKMIGCMTSRGP